MISFKSRRDELAYFLGFVSKNRGKQLDQSLREYCALGYSAIEPKDAFEECPFNDDLSQIIRSYYIWESGKKDDLPFRISDLLGQFIFLISDYAPDCCDDGRLFYCKADKDKIVMECDRCGQMYDLDGKKIDVSECKKMTQDDFLSFFEKESFTEWPYAQKLKKLPRVDLNK